MPPSTSNISSLIDHAAKYAYDPEKWANDILRFEPDSWQSKAMRDFIEGRFVAFSTGSGVGKTALLAVLILFFLCNRPFPKIPCTAPTQHQLHDILWAEIRKWMRRSELISNFFTWTQTKISLRGHEEEWFAVARTSRPKPNSNTVEGLQGFHAEHILFVLDEASGIPDQVTGAVDGALTTKGAHVIMASNPTRNTGYFHRTVTDPKVSKDWRISFVNAENSKFVTKDSIQKLKDRYGSDSDYYRMRVKGLFPRSDSTALITPEQMLNAHTRLYNEKQGRKILSLDPARYGSDDAVLYGSIGYTLTERHVFSKMDSSKLCDVACDLFNNGEYDELRIDDVGMGGPILDFVKKKLGKSKVVGVTAGAKPIFEDDKFINLRAEIFWNLKEEIDKISIPFETDNLDEELTNIHYKWDSKDKKIQIESKDIIRMNLGRSCGDADALAIMYGKLKHENLTHSVYFAMGAKDSINSDRSRRNINTNSGNNQILGQKNTNSGGRLTNFDTWKLNNNRIGKSRFRDFS